eukprot:Opistho-1_new@85076
MARKSDAESLLSERALSPEFELDGDEDVLFSDDDAGLMLGQSRKEIDLRKPNICRRMVATPERRVALISTILMVIAVAITAVVVVVGRRGSGGFAASDRPRNVIFMISDGYGPAAQTLARTMASLNAKPDEETSPMDAYLVGTSRTRSSSSHITDSAAGATAFACALKTRNKAVGVDADGRPCGTILEAAEAAGYRTGIVVTSYMTDATPASFSAHVGGRSSKDLIAEQMLSQGIDVLLGGGLGYFLPRTDPQSLRADNKNLIETARANMSYNVITDANDLAKLSSLPVLGLFSKDYLDLVVDRNRVSTAPRQPSLSEMVDASLRLLTAATAASEKGFFLIVEGSQIDIAGHMNDAVALAAEAAEYNEAFARVLKFAQGRTDTLVVSTSDHETGGLTIGYQYNMSGLPPDYAWDPLPLTRANASSLAVALDLLKAANDSRLDEAYVRDRTFGTLLGIKDPTQDEVDAVLKEASDESSRAQSRSDVQFGALSRLISHTVAKRCGIGFTTMGHTGVDVNVYAYGPRGASFAGNQDNTRVGLRLWDAMGLDRDATTEVTRRRFGNHTRRGLRRRGAFRRDPVHPD